jgi:hypothetical protein
MKISKTHVVMIFLAILIVVLVGFGSGVHSLLTLLQLVLFVCLFFLPTIILGVIMRLPPIYRLVRRNRFVRVMVVLGNGLLCLGIAYLMITWVATILSYDIGAYYAKRDLPSGITLDATWYKSAVFKEMWLRQIIPGTQSQTCFSGKAIVCQIADMVSNIGSGSPNNSSWWFIFLGVAFLPTLFNFLLSWKYTREPDAKAG